MPTISVAFDAIRRYVTAYRSRRLLATAVVLLAAGRAVAGSGPDTVSEVTPVFFGQYGIETRQRVTDGMIELEFYIAPDSVLFNKLPLLVIEDPGNPVPLVAVVVQSDMVEDRRVVGFCLNEKVRANAVLRFVAQGRNPDRTPRSDDLQPQGGRMYHQLRLRDMPAPPVDTKAPPAADPKLVPPVKAQAAP